MAVHQLRKEYNLFIDQFMQWARAAGAEVHVPENASVQIAEMANGQIAVTSLFHLANWPFKGASRKINGLTVLVRTREIYDSDNVLVKSNVNTLYFKPTKKGAPMVPEVAIHYDYKQQMDIAHPVFHAQLGAKDIPEADLKAVAFNREIDLSTYQPISSIRIPTVHVGLPAALLAVCADHLEKASYYGFLDAFSKNTFFNRPLSFRLDRCRELKMRTQDQLPFRSHNMYM
ncbi:hypothetical protein [Janthinobacterium sp. YR213]|uniref:hypothetical protein n=1 Tax=Janthinobacterium sp. YR213 TaxID=1881027 RepID=UPI000888701B|nr:hypothetical protein [Janthinobacterium sp. YR213]SDG77179.1 hypothetical protein SAMN05428968_0819 [Janthinobacterium sp. YR213]